MERKMGVDAELGTPDDRGVADAVFYDAISFWKRVSAGTTRGVNVDAGPVEAQGERHSIGQHSATAPGQTKTVLLKCQVFMSESSFKWFQTVLNHFKPLENISYGFKQKFSSWCSKYITKSCILPDWIAWLFFDEVHVNFIQSTIKAMNIIFINYFRLFNNIMWAYNFTL